MHPTNSVGGASEGTANGKLCQIPLGTECINLSVLGGWIDWPINSVHTLMSRWWQGQRASNQERLGLKPRVLQRKVGTKLRDESGSSAEGMSFAYLILSKLFNVRHLQPLQQDDAFPHPSLDQSSSNIQHSQPPQHNDTLHHSLGQLSPSTLCSTAPICIQICRLFSHLLSPHLPHVWTKPSHSCILLLVNDLVKLASAEETPRILAVPLTILPIYSGPSCGSQAFPALLRRLILSSSHSWFQSRDDLVHSQTTSPPINAECNQLLKAIL
ncbi:hypothetical protein JAAARDRAFT_594195 [Jaapia argillacea MUCL 33604]|uniref:Uncharacterized protein n=1 Tax=Jaapia argillacea MUCL 33604 TaxID=933084 RepID=A0A067PZB6_9AGAM|nr:hypothetical protein JAAARDRAFT_594195 [Jaapia argillacea MUCL 33604]